MHICDKTLTTNVVKIHSYNYQLNFKRSVLTPLFITSCPGSHTLLTYCTLFYQLQQDSVCQNNCHIQLYLCSLCSLSMKPDLKDIYQMIPLNLNSNRLHHSCLVGHCTTNTPPLTCHHCPHVLLLVLQSYTTSHQHKCVKRSNPISSEFSSCSLLNLGIGVKQVDLLLMTSPKKDQSSSVTFSS